MAYKLEMDELNKVLAGGIREGESIHIFGPKQSGKSIFSYQLSIELMRKSRGNVLFIDTEKSFLRGFHQYWTEVFKRRFNLDFDVLEVNVERYAPVKGKRGRREKMEVLRVFESVLMDLGIKYSIDALERAVDLFLTGFELKANNADKAVYVLEISNAVKLLALLGVEGTLEGSGKQVFKVNNLIDPEFSSLAGFIKERGIKIVVLDSFGMLIKNTVSSDIANLPTRANISNQLLGRLLAITTEIDLISMVTNHASQDPSTKRLMFFGGSPVGYSFKYSFYMKRGKDQNSRILVVYRSPHLPDKSVEIELKIGNDGFRLNR
ncbi:hypothetical protein DRN86_02830 [Candidatus Geothermarchaeota archaeon]|nr:MAG: hypothetical protein DRN86_02830 [Candidatus Geothermarchaeota archaeon]